MKADVTTEAEVKAVLGRLTNSYKKRDDRRLIVHSHFSAPAAGQAEDESFPT